MKCYIEGNTLILDYEKAKYKTLLGIFFTILSLIYLAFGLFLVYNKFVSIILGDLKTFSNFGFIPLTHLILGIFFLINSIKYLITNDYNPFIIIDKNNQIIKFYKNKKTLLYEVNLIDISRILAEHEETVDIYYGTRNLYKLYLIRNDGAYLWIYKVYEDKNLFSEILNKILDFTGLDLENNTNIIFDKKQHKNYKNYNKKTAFSLDYFYSIKEIEENNNITFLIKNKNFKNLLIPLIILTYIISFGILIEYTNSKLFNFLYAITIVLLLQIIIFKILSKIPGYIGIKIFSQGIIIKIKFKILTFLNYENFIQSQFIKNLTLNRSSDNSWCINIKLNPHPQEKLKSFNIRLISSLKRLAFKIINYNYSEEAFNILISIPEKIIGSDNYYHNNFIFELDYLVRKSNEILRKNI